MTRFRTFGLWLVLAGAIPAGLRAAPATDPAAPPAGRVIERVLAVVNDEVVLWSEVERVVEDMMRAEPPPAGADARAYEEARRREVLDTLIAEKLLEQEMRKLQIEVSDAEIDRIVEGTKRQHGLDDQKLEQALAQQGLSLAEYREGLRKQLMKARIVQLKIKSQVQVSDEEVKTRAAQSRALEAADFRVRARHILFLVPEGEDESAARSKADAALARVRAGEDFASLAVELSEGPSAPRGGALGVFGRGEMVPAFERAAFAAEPGSVVGPVRTPFGWHLIYVEERVAQGADEGALEERLRQQIYEAEVERAFQRYVDELREAAFIDIRPAR